MREFNQIFAEQYDMVANEFECVSCGIIKSNHLTVGKCPHYGKFILKVIKMKQEDMNRIKKYAEKKGDNPFDHYIREAITEYLRNHECTI